MILVYVCLWFAGEKWFVDQETYRVVVKSSRAAEERNPEVQWST